MNRHRIFDSTYNFLLAIHNNTKLTYTNVDLSDAVNFGFIRSKYVRESRYGPELEYIIEAWVLTQDGLDYIKERQDYEGMKVLV